MVRPWYEAEPYGCYSCLALARIPTYDEKNGGYFLKFFCEDTEPPMAEIKDDVQNEVRFPSICPGWWMEDEKK